MYTKIEDQFWKDAKVGNLSPNARYLLLYLLTNPHRNILGCYRLPKGYAQVDTGLSDDDFSSAWDEVITSGMVKYDEAVRVVLLTNYLRYNALDNPNQAKAAISVIHDLQDTALFSDLISSIEQCGKPHVQPVLHALRKRLPEPINKPLLKRLPKPLSEGLQEGYRQPDNRYTDNRDIPEEEEERARASEDDHDEFVAPLESPYDPSVAKIVQLYEKEIAPFYNTTERESILAFFGKMEPCCIEYAILEAAKEPRTRNARYIEGVLNRLLSENVISESSLNERKRRHEAEKNDSRTPYGARSPSGRNGKTSGHVPKVYSDDDFFSG